MKQLFTFLCLFISTVNTGIAQAAYFTKIATYGYGNYSLAIKNDGTLWAWGYNTYGQLGDGTTTNRSVPTQIGSASNWINIAASFGCSLGITSDGKLWVWGFNGYGQYGNGTTGSSSYTPIQVGTATNWVKIACGSSHCLGITADGKLWAWGVNSNGQLGDGTNTRKLVPTQIGTGTDWATIACGLNHSLALTTQGQLWACGFNNLGQLGDGSTIDKSSLVQIGAANNWASIAGGLYHSVAITFDRKLWAWGSNGLGQLGDGSNTSKSNPTQIGIATNWAGISAAFGHTLGVTSDGTLWSWGYNSNGQLGDGTTASKNFPGQIGTPNKWVSVSCGAYNSVATTADGQTLSWGYNNYGQLGDGTTTQRNVPTQIVLPITLNTKYTTTMHQVQYNMYYSNCTLMAIINSPDLYPTPISGLVSVTAWVDATQRLTYLRKHYEITPADNPTTAAGRVTLYFTQNEFDGFNAVNATKLPTGGSDATGISNLLIEKRPGVSSDGSGLPGTYSGAAITINPDDAAVVWNATANRWEVSFEVTGFGGFFVKTQSAVLPARLIGFSGRKMNGANVLTWNTTNEINTKQFIVEWSMDAVQWATLGMTAAKGDLSNAYTYDHTNEPSGKIFYRLKTLDQDGQFTYSNIIWLSGNENTGITIYPNPVKNEVNINAPNALLNTTILLTNMEGKLLQRILLIANQQPVNMQALPSGMYVLAFANGTKEKFIKE